MGIPGFWIFLIKPIMVYDIWMGQITIDSHMMLLVILGLLQAVVCYIRPVTGCCLKLQPMWWILFCLPFFLRLSLLKVDGGLTNQKLVAIQYYYELGWAYTYLFHHRVHEVHLQQSKGSAALLSFTCLSWWTCTHTHTHSQEYISYDCFQYLGCTTHEHVNIVGMYVHINTVLFLL